MEVSIWQAYKDEGVIVWAVAPDDPYDMVLAFAAQMGLSFPVLYDPGGSVHAKYSQLTAFSNTIYPQDWIIGIDGKVAYFSNAYDVAALKLTIESELAKAPK